MFGFLGLIQIAADDNPPRHERRRSGRLACTHLSCEFGDVVDLSAGGTRVWSHEALVLKPDDLVTLTLDGLTGTVETRARALRVGPGRRCGFEAAFQFVDVDDQTARAIRNLAIDSMPHQTLGLAGGAHRVGPSR